MAEVQITTEVADIEMPGGTVARQGAWAQAIMDAANDGKVRITKGIPADQMDKIRRALSHTAAGIKTEQYPGGAGVVTRVVDGALYWQVGEKRVRSASSGTSTPAGSGAGSNGSGAGATPAKAGKGS